MSYIDCVKYPENDTGSDVFTCFIDTERFLESRLGTPIELPGSDRDITEQDQQLGFAYGILHGTETSTDELQRAIEVTSTFLTVNSETDFDSDFSYRVIYDPTVSGDHLYCECIVIVSVARGNGYHTANYGPDRVYHCPDGLVECGFFDWCLSWTSDLWNPDEQMRYTAGYSNSASNDTDRYIDKLNKSDETDPTWKDGQLVVTLADGDTATFTPYL